MRARYGLPAIGPAVAGTWEKEPVRRPITLAIDAAGGIQAPTPDADQEDDPDAQD